jgi:hypothetical protein
MPARSDLHRLHRWWIAACGNGTAGTRESGQRSAFAVMRGKAEEARLGDAVPRQRIWDR